jgi:rhomboid protease GluP
MATPAEPERPGLLERLRRAPVTFALIAVDFAVFAWAESGGSTTDTGTLLRFGAVEPIHVWAGEYWRVATCMFLHIGLVHILMNSYMAIGWATSLERTIGKWRFLVIYLLSGVAGGCASVVSGSLFDPRVSAGASGALFGVLGATFAIRRRLFPSWAAFWADRGVRSVALQVGVWTAIGFQIHLDNAAHLGGLVAGSLAAWLFTSPSAARSRGWLALAAGLGALFVVAARPWWSPTGDSAERVALYAHSYLTGTSPYRGDTTPFPVDVTRGLRFANKGCSHGVALACDILEDHRKGRLGAGAKPEPGTGD